jgi:hypothetical protein
MKVRVTLKDPDGFYESVREAVEASLASMELSDDEREAVANTRMDRTWKALQRWVEHQEYVNLEFDTLEGTATVVPRG